MHESRLVADLVARAEVESAGLPQSISGLNFRIGALCGIPAEALRHGVESQAILQWGHQPDIAIEESVDPTDPNALGIVLVSVRLGA